MRAYSSMPMQEFVDQLRDVAVKANARPAVIDMIDSIDVSDKDAEIEKIGEELTDMEHNRDDLVECLESIEKTLCDRDLDGACIKQMLQEIQDALSRSGGRS